MRRITLLTLLTAALALGQASRVTTGTIRGLIREPGRNPLPSVTVVLGPDLSSQSPTTFTAYAITGADGRFEIPNVPAGTYWVCPQVANSDYLNPCTWDARPPTANLLALPVAAGPSGPPVLDLDLTLARGTALFVQVDDPNFLIEKQGNLAVGARSASGHTVHAPPPFKTTGGQRLYRLIVPLGAPYTPILDTGKFQVEHGAPGERLASPFGQPAESRIGEAAKVFRLTVRSVTR